MSKPTRRRFGVVLLAAIALMLTLSSCGLFGSFSGDYYLQVLNTATNQFDGKSEYIKFSANNTFAIHTDDQFGFTDVPGTYTNDGGAVVLTLTDANPADYKSTDKYESAVAARSAFEALGASHWTFKTERLGSIILNSDGQFRYKHSPMFDVILIFERIPPILQYLPITMEIAVVSMVFSIIVAFLVAIIKVKEIPVLKHIVSAYVSFTRGTPILIQLYATLYGIPMLLKAFNVDTGFINDIPRITFALVALSLNDAAYSSEAIRAAIQAVDKGQIEAAQSIGMTSWQTLRRVTIPESLVIALPSLGNAFIGMIKGTSLVFTVSVVEMTRKGQLLSQMDYRYFEMYVTLAIIYWVITFVVSKLLFAWERYLKCNERDSEGGIDNAAIIGIEKKV
ncbi:MAG: amino acid ABC transporter permease [Oscillospiraceae bacterium]|jgi:polar amino acid transport system permease protein|nr:amino acid ABC transporter permease [Oscillospiraceae bacterium]